MEYNNRMISSAQQEYYAKVEKTGAVKYISKYDEYLRKFIGTSDLSIVDIGGGYFANAIKTFYNKNNTNASVSLIDYCKYDEWSLFKDINFINESVLTALEKFPDSSVDICFINYVLHHLTTEKYSATRVGQRDCLKLVS